MFAIVAAALVVWFQRHIEPFVTGTLIIGSTISLWGLWQLVLSNFTKWGGDDGKDLTRRFLAGPRARSGVYFAAFITAALLALTSSNYMRFEGAAAGEREFIIQAVEVVDGKIRTDKIFAGPFTVHPGDVFGHPSVARLRTRHLEYQILKPRGFEPLPKTLYPWTALDIKVPGSFKRKVYHNIVLVPDPELLSNLPAPTDPRDSGARYYLRIVADGHTTELTDYMKGLVITGSGEEDLQSVDDVQGDANVRRELTDQFKRIGLGRPDQSVAGLMSGDLYKLASPEFSSGAKVTVEVGTWQPETGPKIRTKKFSCELTAPVDGVLHAQSIGRSAEGKCK